MGGGGPSPGRGGGQSADLFPRLALDSLALRPFSCDMVDVLLPLRAVARRMFVNGAPAIRSPGARSIYSVTPRPSPISDKMSTPSTTKSTTEAAMLLSTPAIAKRWNGSPSCPPRNLACWLDEAACSP